MKKVKLTLRQVFRPAFAGGATVILVVVFYLKGAEAKTALDAKIKATGATGLGDNVTWWNPGTWGNVMANVGREVMETAEIASLWLQVQVLAGAMVATALIGGLLTTYFIWTDIVKRPEEITAEQAAKERVATRAIEVGLPAAAAAANPASAPAQAPAIVAPVAAEVPHAGA